MLVGDAAHQFDEPVGVVCWRTTLCLVTLRMVCSTRRRRASTARCGVRVARSRLEIRFVHMRQIVGRSSPAATKMSVTPSASMTLAVELAQVQLDICRHRAGPARGGPRRRTWPSTPARRRRMRCRRAGRSSSPLVGAEREKRSSGADCAAKLFRAASAPGLDLVAMGSGVAKVVDRAERREPEARAAPNATRRAPVVPAQHRADRLRARPANVRAPRRCRGRRGVVSWSVSGVLRECVVEVLGDRGVADEQAVLLPRNVRLTRASACIRRAPHRLVQVHGVQRRRVEAGQPQAAR